MVDSRAPSTSTPTPFRVLVVGGSYGGLSAALNLQDLCNGRRPRCGPAPAEGETEQSGTETEQSGVETPNIAIDITIVDERDGFYHLIGSPLAVADQAYAQKAWVLYKDIPALREPNVRVLHGSVQGLDPKRKVAAFAARGSGTQTTDLPYDYLVAAAGLRRVWPVVPQSLRKKQYLFETSDYTRAATTARHGAVIVGGGAVGIEMAAELKLVHPEVKVTLVHSRDKLLSAEPLPDEVKDRSLELLREAGVDVLLAHRLERTDDARDASGNACLSLRFANGHTLLADHVAMAVSKSVPSTAWLPRGALDDDGYVRVDATLTFPPETPNAAHHLAVGDMIRWSGIKRCGGAMHMGYYAAHNLHQRLLASSSSPTAETPKFLELAEVPPMIGLAVGKNAVSYWPGGGMTSGEDVMTVFFGDDLGFTICWNHLRLGGYKSVPEVPKA
ncbi:pyridine nucleotide-disulfide oxidoreductase-like protein [Lasiosphaeria miniovina]|uniref:Pyridine nucleotide-disulfide oxidoreductase-like protein n=1 Tax=Lasiosphaeria miniovina TaxID=1954250 RepID=A0AA40ADM3_9PEZI|nr:pyridine nucleotide-disulfide oxidoreductase-like protein [Lasiosphaeria miniovina]KAK0713933.1 pyridine nucleotide-disulfide oxidoreductase-like protein [Lasiosphaeria miniovina]